MTMSTAPSSVSDMLVTVKSREAQRGLLAEMRGDGDSAIRHFLAAAHLEMVLAADYDEAGDPDLALRSRLSAASCLWRGGQDVSARRLIEQLTKTHPEHSPLIHKVLDDLESNVPVPPS
jgi:hypothetical protein